MVVQVNRYALRYLSVTFKNALLVNGDVEIDDFVCIINSYGGRGQGELGR